MPPLLSQNASWPGVVAFESASYTCSHGITPGLIRFNTYPQPPGSTIATRGNFTMSDGKRRLVLKNCRVSRMDASAGPDGQTYTVEVHDRRWKWQGRGAISGDYNRLDPRGKLIPWKIRSPKELAILCLEAMGERNYVIKLPPGLPRAIGANLNNYLLLGQNFPETLTNPEAIWDYTPPAEALARLADKFGCRVVFDPVMDRVLVVPLGDGAGLSTDAPCEAISPSFANPRTPEYLGAAGAPVAFQVRFALELVGEEWDHSYQPIDFLSYAPKLGAGQVQISQVRYFGHLPVNLFITFSYTKADGTSVTKMCSDTNPGHTIAERFTAIKACMLGNPEVAAKVGITTTATTIVFTGKDPTFTFTLLGEGFAADGGSTLFGAELVQPANLAFGSWRFSPPPYYPNVKATGRLSFNEAVALAQNSVFRCFRIMNVDLGTYRWPLSLPKAGKVFRRQQIVLLPYKVDGITPQPRLPGAVDINNVRGLQQANGFLGRMVNGVLPEYYNGYFAQQRATCTGSIYKMLDGRTVWYAPNGQVNTDPTERVFAEFEVIPEEQMIKFAAPVFAKGGDSGIDYPRLTLETSCYVAHAETGQLIRWEEKLPLGGDGPPEWRTFEDMKVGVIQRYSDDPKINRPTVVEFDGLDDARKRANHYLTSLAVQYQLPKAEAQHRIGIYPMEMSGTIQQVSYSIGSAGPTTIVSANSEHSVFTLPYPKRRQAENLPPNKAAEMANLLERAGIPLIDPRKKG